jgi:hypothetical protein
MTADQAAVAVFLVFLAAYVLLNVWKFKKPETKLGRFALMALMQVAVFSLRTWGFHNPRLPFTRLTEELEKEIEEMDGKDEHVERKLHLTEQGYRRLGSSLGQLRRHPRLRTLRVGGGS